GTGNFATTYDTAIVESNPGQQIGGLQNFLNNQASQQAGNGGGGFNGSTTDGGVANVRQGVEAALAQFDSQLLIQSDQGSGIMSNTNRPQNVVPSAGFSFFPNPLNLHNGGGDGILSKRTPPSTHSTPSRHTYHH